MQSINKAIRKRTQIENTNKAMFAWIAGASVLLGASLVAIIFLSQMVFFNEKVLAEKEKTISVLESNNESVIELQKNVRALDTNQALIDLKSKPDDRALQVILDALPSDANSLALGASLQNKLLFGVDGIVLESLSVDQVAGVETSEGDSAVADASASTGGSTNVITFRFSVFGDTESLRKVLVNLEKSIRTIYIDDLKFEKQQNMSQRMSVQGHAFYEPSKEVKLVDKAIKQ